VTTTARDARGCCCCGMPCLEARVARIGAGIVRQVILDMRLRSNMNSGQASRTEQAEQGASCHRWNDGKALLCWRDKEAFVKRVPQGACAIPQLPLRTTDQQGCIHTRTQLLCKYYD
jgi:hypothetical protein